MIARFHAWPWPRSRRRTSRALVSRSAASAEKMAHELNLKLRLSTDLTAVLARPDIDAVIITTPSGPHLEPAVAAAGRASTSSSRSRWRSPPSAATASSRRATASRVKLCTIFPSRFARRQPGAEVGRRGGPVRPADAGRDDLQVVAAAGVLRRGRLEGDAGARRRRGADEPGHPQCRSAAVDDGPVTQVGGFTATLAHERIEVEDTAVACLRFASGALGVIQAATSVIRVCPRRSRSTATGEQWSIEQEDVLRWELTPETAEDRAIRRVRLRRSARRAGRATRRRSRTPATPGNWPTSCRPSRATARPLVDGREGRKAVALIEAIYRSAGRTVERAVVSGEGWHAACSRVTPSYPPAGEGKRGVKGVTQWPNPLRRSPTMSFTCSCG